MSSTKAIAVYCGSSMGTEKAFAAAARSVGKAIAESQYGLVYGGGASGIMGIVSSAVLEAGGSVLGVVPYQMVAGGGEGDMGFRKLSLNQESERDKTIIVHSMHERKVEMAKRVDGFIGLPGGFGTFEEVLEATTWTQLGIHRKPVVVVNVLNFYEPLRALVETASDRGFIQPRNKGLMVFVDGPEDLSQHEDFDWGTAALKALEAWDGKQGQPIYDWNNTVNGKKQEPLAAT